MSHVAANSSQSLTPDPVTLLSVAARSTWIRSRGALHKWLEGEMRTIIPHDKMLVARRDSGSGQMTFELVSSAGNGPHDQLQSSLPRSVQEVFDRWLEAGGLPITVPADALRDDAAMFGCEAILAHGVADERANAHYLYMFLGQTELDRASTREASAVLMPFIDCGLRKLLGRPDTQAVDPHRMRARAEAVRPAGGGDALSRREIEVMGWVCAGKTNLEIADLLGLSKATVKNHLRRIFQKLEVMNRAQAVETFERQLGPG